MLISESMDTHWKTEFFATMPRNDVSQERAFLALVDQVDGHCSLDVARVLMKSFNSKPDYGTQERVVSVLASAEKSVSIRAILEELPRLISEAPEWADVLIGQEVDRRPERLSEIAGTMSENVRVALNRVLNGADFLALYPNAKLLKI